MFLAMSGRPLSDFPQVATEFFIEILGPPLARNPTEMLGRDDLTFSLPSPTEE
jgi:hypothetical protein